MNAKREDELRKLPQVGRLLEEFSSEKPTALQAIRTVLEKFRSSIDKGATAPSIEEVLDAVTAELDAVQRLRLRPIVNATGVLLHTNLGRAPISSSSLDAAGGVASRYSNLEYDLVEGRRGTRYEHARRLLAELTGAESALVVNNNAAAILLSLAALAGGRDVIVSRGELIEIGGEFRIPEILAESGARLIEVGTTNRTHLRDYERALGENTAAIMKVHPSNYRVVGFTAAVEARDLSELAHSRDLLLIHDLGSGLIRRRVAELEPEWLRDEPTVVEAIGDGADIVTFSGDKLLGGPQAGIILGSDAIIERLQRSPLLRALRVDKLTLAALESTLVAYMDGKEAELPFWQMALAPADEIESRARAILDAAGDLEAKVELVEGASVTGGGSSPQGSIPTVLMEITPRSISAQELIGALLERDLPVVARITADRVIIDVRTVLPEQDRAILDALMHIL